VASQRTNNYPFTPLEPCGGCNRETGHHDATPIESTTPTTYGINTPWVFG
jgi:hypothetical protein